MPAIMLIHLVEIMVYSVNYFPLASGVSPYYSPRMIVEKKKLNYKLHLEHCFGDYVLAPAKTTNTPAMRRVDCIYLGPRFNVQGSHYLFNLQTRAVITRNAGLTKLPINYTIIDMVNQLGIKQELLS